MEEKSVAICLKVANEATYYSVELTVLWPQTVPLVATKGIGQDWVHCCISVSPCQLQEQHTTWDILGIQEPQYDCCRLKQCFLNSGAPIPWGSSYCADSDLVDLGGATDSGFQACSQMMLVVESLLCVARIQNIFQILSKIHTYGLLQKFSTEQKNLEI